MAEVNKNPFEIRLEALKMAKDYLDQTVSMNEQFAWKALEMAKEQGKDVTAFWKEITPTMYQPDEIIKKADQFYKFISSK